MSILRCSFKPADLPDRWPLLKQAYLCGADDIPWRTWTDVRPGLLTCVAEVNDSCACHVPWPVSEYGWLGLRTTTLPERQEPYDLNVELVRGKMARVQEVQRELEEGGIQEAIKARGALREVRKLFFEMIFRADPDRVADLSDAALNSLIRLGDRLVLTYAQVVCTQRRQLNQMPLVMARVSPEEVLEADPSELTRYINAVQLLAPWSSIEKEQGDYDWSLLDRAIARCKQAGLNVGIGPLICWEKYALPDWLWLYADNFDSILRFATTFVSHITARYGADVRIWELASRVNCGAALVFDAADRLRLAVHIVEAAAASVSQGFTYITIGQPWSEYSAHVEDTGAFYFADTLSRVERGLKGLGIELATGYGAGMSWPRDLVDTAYLLARYGVLGVPLILALAAPIETTDASPSIVQTECLNGTPLSHGRSPMDWLANIVKVGASRPNVAGFVWSHVGLKGPGMYPRAGCRSDSPLAKQLFANLNCQC